MNYILIIRPVLEVLALTVPVLLSVAYVTVAERKTMASMQRRLGPNVVGFYGSLQAFADALKLLLKEYVAPSQANTFLFFLGPIITLIFSLLVFAVVPFGPGLTIYNSNLGILYLLALSSISTYGILLAGWSANSKYAFLGSLRSTAQLISYELILTSAILLAILFTGSLNLIINVEAQRAVWFIIPLFPVFIIFLIGSVAETNRAPFDLAEAESELVSGFMTEHSAVIFVFFFLAEYASIVFMCILVGILFLGGYLYKYISFDLFLTIYHEIQDSIEFIPFRPVYKNIIPEETLNTISLSIKTSIMVFTFIWVRASFPRIRYDQLMSYCWTILLPLVIAFIIYVPCVLQNYDIIPVSATLIAIPPIKIVPRVHKSNNLNSFVMYDLVVLINTSVYNYIKNFNFIYLMKSFIKFRFKSIVYALIVILPLQLYLHITTGRLDISLELLWVTSGYIVLGIICYKILYLPWKHTTLIPFAVRFILNCSIVSFVIITILLLFNNLNIDNLSLGIILPVLWEDCLIFIKGDNGEGGSGEGGSDSKGPNPQIPDPKEPEILGVASSKVASSEKTNSEESSSEEHSSIRPSSEEPSSEEAAAPAPALDSNGLSASTLRVIDKVVDKYGDKLKDADDRVLISQLNTMEKAIKKGESRGQDVEFLKQYIEQDGPEDFLRKDSEIEQKKEIYRKELIESAKTHTRPETTATSEGVRPEATATSEGVRPEATATSEGVRPEDIPMQSIETDNQVYTNTYANRISIEEYLNNLESSSGKNSSEEPSNDGENYSNAGKSPANESSKEESLDTGKNTSKRAKEESPDNGEGPSNKKVK